MSEPRKTELVPRAEEQAEYWREVDAAHFAWQTEHPYIARTEAALLGAVELRPGDRVLEVGCGEGANLQHLLRRADRVVLFAVDYSLAKVRFARARLDVRIARADAGQLPFRTGSFDAVLMRDVLHHVVDRRAVLREAVRVLRPGGRITLIEPNGRNPLIALMAAGIRAERAMLSSTPDRAAEELRQAGADVVAIEPRQPFPISRVVLHYRLGAPSLGRTSIGIWLLRLLERLAQLLPRSIWAYFVVRGVAQ